MKAVRRNWKEPEDEEDSVGGNSKNPESHLFVTEADKNVQLIDPHDKKVQLIDPHDKKVH